MSIDSDDEDITGLSDIFVVSDAVEDYKYTFADDLTLTIKGQELQNQNIQPTTGLLPWPAASILGHYIAFNRKQFVDKTVLELGTGVGVCGLAVSKFARTTVMSDGEQSTFEQLELNIDNNKHLYMTRPTVVHLGWGNNSTLDTIKQSYGGNHFDIIIGSDLVYFDASIEPLFYTVNQLLSGEPGSSFYLSFLDRKNHLPTVERVSTHYKFNMTSVPISTFTKDTTVSTMAKMFIFTRQ
ncbi:hypothetical protein SAMD00019534_121190 [Acytostelium subglobosum LB1]|uniref:hypothetical protein n=1 Tax=Acytostelium subglobosum LB1 TaxID=1410327 RepID=UPI000644FB27|nr:hypothetical protein SAMD00019534_121190 [Acytostelium subglobosum LB1]GAM28943.1 hypothetical protein SAMD00019534_121190 [Acytostelium subglobosum LB1]|eukprot:XP_012748128.1 hypothetical protein SAMD00019534_121190 [Acytostelium subglobosum LB1]